MEVQVGCRALTAHDSIQGAPIRAWLLYATQEPAHPVRFGPYALDLAINAAPVRASLPIVAVSHGNGGTPWSHRDLGVHLARVGFAALMIEHPGNNQRDNSLGSPTGRLKAALLTHRPRHVTLAVDAALADAQLGASLEHGQFALVGHSIGGYTALAVAGGRPMTVPDDVDEARLIARDPTLRELAFAVPVEPDRRLRAAVLLAPAIPFFAAPGALADVVIPLLVRTGEHDHLSSTAEVGRTLQSLGDPARASLVEVPGAGHFSFQSPFPPELAHIPPAQDPPGFDRARYQAILCAEVAAFLRG